MWQNIRAKEWYAEILFTSAKRNQIPMCRIAGKNYYSKRHIDEFFGTAVDIHSITEWVTADNVEDAFSMSKSALRAYTYRHKIPTKRESMARQNRYIGVLDKFIHEGHEALSSFAKTDRVNFNEKESASIYYGIMASAVKHNIGLDSKACIESAAKSFLSGMSWKGFTDFKQECVTSWTKLFATNEVQFTNNAIDTFLAFVDYMSCSADTYVSLGGSNGCADQLTNWDGTQKVGLGEHSTKERKRDEAIKEQRIVTNRFHHLCYLSVRVESIIIKRGIPIIASKEYIAASQYIFAVSHKEALCIKTNDCTFAA